jgi:UDP:flavonoid glycosyltransferase YjiC (YdhE family)
MSYIIENTEKRKQTDFSLREVNMKLLPGMKTGSNMIGLFSGPAVLGLTNRRLVKTYRPNATPVGSLRKYMRQHPEWVIGPNSIATCGTMSPTTLIEQFKMLEWMGGLDLYSMVPAAVLMCLLAYKSGELKLSLTDEQKRYGTEIKHSFTELTPIVDWSAPMNMAPWDPDSKGTDVIKLIVNEIKNMGGLKKYMKTCSTMRPDECGQITIRGGAIAVVGRTNFKVYTRANYKNPESVTYTGPEDEKTYQSECSTCPMSCFNPTHPGYQRYPTVTVLYKCACCHMLSFHHVRRKTIDGKQVLVFPSNEGNENVYGLTAMVCGCCGTDLSLTIEFVNDQHFRVTEDAINNWGYIGGQLTSLGTMGYLDGEGHRISGYEELSNHQKESLVSNDMKILQAALRQEHEYTTDMPFDTHPELIAWYRSKYQYHIFKASTTLITQNHSLIIDINVTTSMVLHEWQNLGVLHLGAMTPHDNKNVHYVKYVDHLTPKPINRCMSDNVCNHKLQALLLGPGCITMDLATVLGHVGVASSVKLILFKELNEVIGDQSGAVFHTNDVSYMHFDGALTGMQFNLNTHDALTRADVLKIGSDHYVIHTVNETPNILVRSIAGPYTNFNEFTVTQPLTGKINIQLPMPIDGIIDDVSPMQFALKNVDVDIDFLRAICRRDLAGKMSFAALREYAVGYSLRKYSTTTRTQYDTDVTAKEITAVTLLAKLIVSDTMTSLQLATQFSNVMSNIGNVLGAGAQQLLESSVNPLVSTVIFYIKEYLGNVGSWVNLVSWTDMGNSLHTMTTQTNWGIVSAMAESLTDRPCNVWDMSLSIKSSKGSKTCLHHKLKCKHNWAQVESNSVCTCCGMPLQNVTLCNCCKGATFVQVDYDDLIWAVPDLVKVPHKQRTFMKTELQTEHITKNVRTPVQATNKVDTEANNVSETNQVITTTTLKPVGLVDSSEWQRTDVNKYRNAVARATRLIAAQIDEGRYEYQFMTDRNFISFLTSPKNYCKGLFHSSNFVNIPYVPLGTYYDLSSNWRITNITKIKNTDGINDCGLVALRTLWPNEDFQLTDMHGDGLSTEDLSKLASDKGLNLMVLTSDSLQLVHNNSTNEYGVILHSSATAEPGMHYDVGEIELQGRPNWLPVVNPDTGSELYDEICSLMTDGSNTIMDASALDSTAVLAINEQVCCEVANTVVTAAVSVWPRIVKKNNYNYITNNEHCRQDYNTGSYAVSCNTINANAARLTDMFEDYERWPSSELANSAYNSSPDIPDDLTNELSSAVTDCFRELVRLCYNFNTVNYTNLIANTFHSKVVTRGSCCVVSIPNKTNIKIKPLDHVIVTLHGNTHIVTVLMINKNFVMLPLNAMGTLARSKQTIKIMTLKASTGSTIRRLVALSTCNTDGSKIKNKLERATCTLGVAGSGKTREIADAITPNDLAVAMTSGSLESMRQKGINHKLVASVERANSLTNPIVDLYIDEATTLTYINILPTLQRVTGTIHLYGDTTQIGSVDMSATPGIRHSKDLIQYTKLEPTRFNKSWRIGNPLATKLRELSPGFDTHDKHSTNFDITHITSKNLYKLGDILATVKPDCILGFYKATGTEIKPFNRDNVPYYTIHSKQGMECDRAVVLFMASEQGSFELACNKLYLMAALTRARDYVHLVLVNYPSDSTNLNELTVTRGGKLYDLPSSTPYNVRTMHLMTEHDLINLNNLKISRSGATLTFKRDVDGTHVEAVKFGSVLVKLTNNDGQITATGMLHNEALKNSARFDEPFIITQVNSHTSAEVTSIFEVNQTRIRMVSWLLDMHVSSNTIKVMMDQHYVTITKSKGCPYYCGLSFNNGIETVTISGLYTNPMTRKIYTDGDSGLYQVVKEWATSWEVNRWPTVIEPPQSSKIDLIMLMDRLKESPHFILTTITNSQLDNCTNAIDKYTTHVTAIINANQLCTTSSKQWVVKHKYVIGRPRNMFHSATRYIWSNPTGLYDIEGLVENNVLDAANLWDKVQDDVYNLQFIPFNFSGARKIPTIMSLTKHKLSKTKIGVKLIKSETDRVIRSSVQYAQLLKLSDSAVELKIILDRTTPHCINIMGSNTEIPSGSYNELIEGLMVASLGRMGKSGIIVFAGLDPSTLANQGKFYLHRLNLSNTLQTKTWWDQGEFHLVNSLRQLVTYTEGDEEKKQLSSCLTRSATVLPEGADRVLLGLNICWLNTEELYNMCKLTKDNVYGIVPCFQEYAGAYKLQENFILLNGTRLTMNVNMSQIAKLISGIPLKHNEFMIRATVIHTVYGCNYVRLTTHKLGPVTVMMCRSMTNYNNITVDMPWINTNIHSLLSGHPLITTRTLTINTKMLRMASLRLLANDGSVSTALAFVRTMASTYELNAEDMRLKEDAPVDVIMSTAYTAYFMHKNMSRNVSIVERLLIQLTTSETLGNNQQIAALTLKLVEAINTLCSSIMDPNMIAKALRQLHVGVTGSQVRSMINRVKVKLNDRSRSFITYIPDEVDEHESSVNQLNQSSNDQLYSEYVDNNIFENHETSDSDNYYPDQNDSQTSTDFDENDITLYDSEESDGSLNDTSSSIIQEEPTKTEGSIDDILSADTMAQWLVTSRVAKEASNIKLNDKIMVKQEPIMSNNTQGHSDTIVKVIENHTLVSNAYQPNHRLTIYSFWNDEQLPELIRYSINTWVQSGHTVNMITLANLGDYVPVATYINLERKKHKIQHISDWLRLYVINKRGGWWLDASVFLSQKLTTIFDLPNSAVVFWTTLHHNTSNAVVENCLILCDEPGMLDAIVVETENSLINFSDADSYFNSVDNQYGLGTTSKFMCPVQTESWSYLRNFLCIELHKHKLQLITHLSESTIYKVQCTISGTNAWDDTAVANILCDDQTKGLFPIVKLINSQRSAFMNVVKNSSIVAGHHSWVDDFRDWNSKQVLTNQQFDVLFYTIGSNGDIQPMRNLANYLTSKNYKCAVLSHWDLKPTHQEKYLYVSLNKSSAALTPLAALALRNSDISTLSYINEANNDMVNTYMNTCSTSAKLLIATPYSPQVKSLAIKCKSEILWLSPFPWCPAALKNAALLPQNLITVLDKYTNFISIMSQQSLQGFNLQEPIIYAIDPIFDVAIPDYQQYNTIGCMAMPTANDKMYNTRLPATINVRKMYMCVGFGSIWVDNLNQVYKTCAKWSADYSMQLLIIHSNETMPTKAVVNSMQHYKNVTVLSKVNYTCVLSDSVMMVCHGGSGVIHTSISLECPLVVVPIFGDQHMWASLILKQQFGLIGDLENQELLKESLTNCFKNRLKIKDNMRKSHIRVSPDYKTFEQIVESILGVKNHLESTTTTTRAHTIVSDLSVTNTHGIMRVNYELVYNPQTDKDCVFKSLTVDINEHCQEYSALRHICKPWMTDDESMVAILSLGYNAAISDQNGIAKYRIFHENLPFICLVKLDMDLSQHMCRAKFTLQSQGEEQNKQPLDYTEIKSLLPNFVNITFEEFNTDSEKCSALLVIDTNITKRLELKAYMILTLRLKWFISWPTSQTYQRFCKLNYMFGMSSGDIVRINYSQGYTIGFIVVQGVNAYLAMVNEPVINIACVINIGIKLPNMQHKTIQTNMEPQYVAYDINAKQQSVVTRNLPRLGQVWDGTNSDQIVVIYNYDNRAHHKRDINLAATDNKIVLINDDSCNELNNNTRQKLHNSYNKPYDRLAIVCGKSVKVIECNQAMVKQIMPIMRAIDSSCSCSNTEIRYTVELPTILTDMFSQIPTVSTHRLTPIRHESDEITKLELTADALNVIVSQLLGDSDTYEIVNHSPNLTTNDLINYKDGVIYLAEQPIKTLIIVRYMEEIRLPVRGGNTDDIRNNKANVSDQDDNRWHWRLPVAKPIIDKTKNNDANTKQIVTVRPIPQVPIHDVNALMMLKIFDVKHASVNFSNDDVGDCVNLYIGPTTSIMSLELEHLSEMIPHLVIDLWENNDQFQCMTIMAPKDGKLRTRETPERIITVRKACMTRYPIISRAVHTKRAFAELNAIVYRLHTVQHIRHKTLDPNYILENMASAFFRSDWGQYVNNYTNQKLTYSPEGTLNWLNNHPDAPDKLKQVIATIAGDFLTKPLNSVNVHLKLESLFKEEPIFNWDDQIARIIVWQHYAVAAIYSPIFMAAKNRLKSILNSKTVYTDGLQPSEIAARLRLVTNVDGFFENDLTKQDRQTDHELLDVEFKLYELLGVHDDVISAWMHMHSEWKYKAGHTTGYGDAMRLTGQATTALGNVITNMQVHSTFVKENQDEISLSLFLGDDALMVCNSKPDVVGLRGYIATYFNMQAKESYSTKQGNFCSMMAYKSEDGRCGLGPDFYRMFHRFQVTNGVHEVTPENIEMRRMSYLSQLGALPPVLDMIAKYNLPIQPELWYDYHHTMQATAHRYGMTYDEVEVSLANLFTLLDINEPVMYDLTYYTSTAKRNS